MLPRLLLSAISQSPSNTTAKLTETIVIAKMGTKPYCSQCGGEADRLKLSPDGAYVARLHAIFDPKDPEGMGRNTVEVSDVRSARIVATFKPNDPPFPTDAETESLHYCDSGKYLIFYGGLSKIYVLDTKTYLPHASFELPGFLLQSSCAANGSVAAFHMGDPKLGAGQGVTKIFDLDTSEEIHVPDEIFSRPGISEVIVSPSGNHVAIYGAQSYVNGKFFTGNGAIVVVDMQTKTICSRIASGGTVMFAGESNIALERAAESTRIRHKSDPPGSDQPTIHVWNISSGSELQVIKDLDPKANDVRFWGISADGRTFLAYTGKATGKEHDKVKEARFSLWDRESARMIALSPSLRIIHHGCPVTLFGGRCNPFDETPLLTLSQSGNAVAVWYASGGEPVIVYTVPPTTLSH